MIRIAISGSFGVGKSTLSNEIVSAAQKIRPDLETVVIGNISRDLISQGRVTADQGSLPDHYCAYVSEHVRRLLEAKADLLIHERTLLDTLCYVSANGNATREFQEMLFQLARWHATSVDLYFYIPIEFPIVSDGVRPLDKAYRENIDCRMRSYLKSFNIKYIELTGTPESRASVALDQLKSELASHPGRRA